MNDLFKINKRWFCKIKCASCNRDVLVSKYYISKHRGMCNSCTTIARNKSNKGIAVKHSHNRTYFLDKTLQSAYWAGFLAADGCISDDGVVTLKLSEKDSDVLTRFIEDTSYSGSILNSGNENRKRVVITAHDWVKDLKEIYNITTRKSLTLKSPNIDDEDLVKSYISGYIDGDGTVCLIKKKWLKLGIIGTLDTCNWIKTYFDKWIVPTKAKCEIQQKITKNKIILYEYTVYGKRAAKLIKILQALPIKTMSRKLDRVLPEYYTKI